MAELNFVYLVWKNSEIMGVFSTEELAKENCTGPEFCYWPMKLNERAPEESVEFPNPVFPYKG